MDQILQQQAGARPSVDACFVHVSSRDDINLIYYSSSECVRAEVRKGLELTLLLLLLHRMCDGGVTDCVLEAA